MLHIVLVLLEPMPFNSAIPTEESRFGAAIADTAWRNVLRLKIYVYRVLS